MKISKIKISKFHQFEDFELDLTYPKGHEKAGKPLDKVCFIGQSGTGKTTLLEMIRQVCLDANFSNPRYNYEYERIKFEDGQGAYFIFKHNEESFTVDIDSISSGFSEQLTSPIANVLLYFSTGLAQAKLEEEARVLNEVITEEGRFSHYEPKVKPLMYFPITYTSLQPIWDSFYRFIREYQQIEANFRINLTRRYEKEKVDLVSELKNWKNNNPNPLVSVAKECLDTILNRFNLAVQTEIIDVKGIKSLQIRSLSEDIIIPYEHLSTGTKQIIFTAFPIYQLLEDDSIVLMDEPETSLYPDIQREIIPYYTSFDKNKTSQFFFATHSPIIASAFEPWEIVELKFDEKGKVYRDKYYEGENHVDNYKIDPRYLRWDDILTKVFDMEVDSNAEFRSAKLTEYAILKDKVKSWKEEGKLAKPTKAIEAEVAKFEKMYDLLTGNWAVTRHEKN